MTPTRPALRWHGGKWKLAPWIISHFPPHRVYVEPFGGAASVLFRKPTAYAEYYNDLDHDVVNFFEVMRNFSDELIRQVRLTPFARAEFERAYKPAENPIDQARKLLIRSFMGFGSDGHNRARRTGFRSTSDRSGTTPAHDWANLPKSMTAISERLQGVTIECRDAAAVMLQYDRINALHFVDPPYVHSTRAGAVQSSRNNYTREMSDADHEQLLTLLRRLKVMVILCGYPNPLYDAALSDWHRVERIALADGARKRVEVLWLNASASSQMPSPMLISAGG